ncbi:MAG: VOC family protein [Acidobacteriaceae bacterium]
MSRVNQFSRRRFAVAAVSTAATAVLPDVSRADTTTQNVQGNAVTSLTPYLLFDGNCHQAMEFYRTTFGGQLTVMKVKDSRARDHMPSDQFEKIINARLTSGKVEISASDWLRPDRKRTQGNTVCLYLSGGTPEELKVLFERLSQGGDVTDPMTEQFFGIYGALNDRFGVRWMFRAATNGW